MTDKKPTPSPLAGDHPSARDLKIAELVKRGATMEEIAQLIEPLAKTPADAVRALKAGNARFFSGQTAREEVSPLERRAHIIAQSPFAIVLSCADSRVPVELVFDAGFGQIFAIRIAGNIVAPATLGSIEYAILHLNPHVLVVMGHEGCGAVSAAMTLTDEQLDKESENIRLLIERIGPAVRDIPPIRDKKARMREAVIASVRQQVHNAKLNPVVAAALKKKHIAVIGAYYGISSGAVDFLETEEDLRL